MTSMVGAGNRADAAQLRWEQQLTGIPHAPRASLELDADRPWETLRLGFDEPRAELIHSTLEHGRTLDGTSRQIGGETNGLLEVRTFVDDATGTRVDGVLKPIDAGGTQELFAYDAARAMHLDHLLPVTARRPDGAAAIELRPGATFEQAHITSGDRLEHAFRHRSRLLHPAMSPAEIATRARIDRQLVQAFDVVLANADRHSGNALFDARTGAISLLDQGLIDRFNPASDGIPYVRTLRSSVGASYVHGDVLRIRVRDEVRTVLERTDRDQLGAAFDQLQRDQVDAQHLGIYARRQRSAYLGEVLDRLTSVVQTGRLLLRHP